MKVVCPNCGYVFEIRVTDLFVNCPKCGMVVRYSFD